MSETPPRPRLQALPPPSRGDKLRRMLWRLVEGTLFRWSPIPLHGWRRLLLRSFGATIGKGAYPYPSASVWAPWNLEMGPRSCLGPRSICYSVARIRLGEGAIVSQGAHLCSATRDYQSKSLTLLAGPIDVGTGAWIAAEAFVGPGVGVGPGAVVGARAVVFKDVPPNIVTVGNPARPVGVRTVREAE